MNFVENNGKKVAAILCVASCFPVVATIYAMETEPGWHGDVYVQDNKTVAKGWKEIEGKSYYFDEDGNLEKEKTQDASVASASTSIKTNVGQSITRTSVNVEKEEEENAAETPAVELSNINEVAETPVETVEVETEAVEQPAEVQALTVEAAPVNDEVIVSDAQATTQEVTNAPQEQAIVQQSNQESQPKATEASNVLEQNSAPAKAETAVQPQTTEQKPVATTPTQTTTTVNNVANVSTDLNSRIVAAAYAAIGTTDGQQCTEVATGVLNEAGVSAGVVWPNEYMQYGYEVSADQATAGNLIYYEDGGLGFAHIGIYVGNGQAVQGNFFGETVLWDAEWDGVSGVHYIQVTE